MNTLEEIEIKVHKMRQALYLKINEKDNLLDLEVLTASQKLDVALNEYNNLINKKLAKIRGV